MEISSNYNEEANLLSTDSKFRSYASSMDKALKAFEGSGEWADLINSLAKMQKVLQSYSGKYTIIPRKSLVAKRLAQVLHPALPSGVHLKALEIYHIIFDVIGRKGLGEDLFLYSTGIFPLLGSCSMSAKPKVLELYENFYVPLGNALQPAMPALIHGVLPGLEEGSEYFNPTLRLLEKFRRNTANFNFAIWKCIKDNSSTRFQALTFIVEVHSKGKQNGTNTTKDSVFIDSEIMIHALCECLQDATVLVQRIALDAVISLTGQANTNPSVSDKDIILLNCSAFNVLLRKDLSLNRRLFSWVFDQSDDVANQGIFLSSLNMFIAITEQLILQNDKNFNRNLMLRPLRVMNTLLDSKTDMNALLMAEDGSVLTNLFRYLLSLTRAMLGISADEMYNRILGSGSGSSTHKLLSNMFLDNRASGDLIKSANLLFQEIQKREPGDLIWQFFACQLDVICTDKESTRPQFEGVNLPAKKITVAELCQFVSFFLDIILLETHEDAFECHIPTFILKMISWLCANCDSLLLHEINDSLKLAMKLIEYVHPSACYVSLGKFTGNLSEVTSSQYVSGVDVETKALSSSKSSLAASDLDDLVEANRKGKNLGKTSDIGETEIRAEGDTSSPTALAQNGNITSEDEAVIEIPEGNKIDTMSASVNRQSSPANSPNDFDMIESHKHSLGESVFSNSSVVEACIKSIKSFFDKMLRSKLFEPSFTGSKSECENVLQRYASYLMERFSDVASFEDELRIRLAKSRNSALVSRQVLASTSQSAMNGITMNGISMKGSVDDFLAVFDLSCKLLHAICTLPVLKDNESANVEFSETEIPPWLMSLFIASCFVANFSIQAKATDCLLQQLALSSEPEIVYSSDQRIITSISQPELQLIKRSYRIYLEICLSLWSWLESRHFLCHERAVDLWLQLHRCCPESISNLCEDVMVHCMGRPAVCGGLEACRRFSVVWHLSRTITNVQNLIAAGQPTFDKCLLVMLDGLSSRETSRRSITKQWLLHCISRGDIARILEPLVLILLHHKTSRILPQSVLVKPIKHSSNYVAEFGSRRLFSVLLERRKDSMLKVSQSATDVGWALRKSSSSSSMSNPFAFSGAVFLSEVEREMMIDSEDFEQVDVEMIVKQILNQVVEEAMLHSDANHLEEPSESVQVDENSNTVKMEQQVSKSDENEESRIKQTGNPIPTITAPIENLTATVKNSIGKLIHKSVESSGKTSSQEDAAVAVKNIKSSPAVVSHLDNVFLSFFMLYDQPFDFNRSLHVFSTLSEMLKVDPVVFLNAVCSTCIGCGNTSYVHQVPKFIFRHNNSIMGKNFFADVAPEQLAQFRNCKFLELLISLSLYHLRTTFTTTWEGQQTSDDRADVESRAENYAIQIRVTEFLTELFTGLNKLIVVSAPDVIPTFINDLMSRCKVQRTVLLCLLCHVKTDIFTNSAETSCEEAQFLEGALDPNGLELKLLELVSVLIQTEYYVFVTKGKSDFKGKTSTLFKDATSVQVKQRRQALLDASFRYKTEELIVCQSFFVETVVDALKQTDFLFLQTHWLNFVLTILPFTCRARKDIVVPTVNQICRNLEILADDGLASYPRVSSLPPDIFITLLESLSKFFSLCTLEYPEVGNSQNHSVSLIKEGVNIDQPGSPLRGWSLEDTTEESKNSPPCLQSTTVKKDFWLDAKKGLLDILPRVLKSLLHVWKRVVNKKLSGVKTKSECGKLGSYHGALASTKFIMGQPEIVRKRIVDIIESLAVTHSSKLYAAVALVWNGHREKSKLRKLNEQFTPDQLLLVGLINSIPSQNLSTIISNVSQVLKVSNPNVQMKKRSILEISILQFFMAYVKTLAANALETSARSILSMVRDSCASTAHGGQVILLLIANYVIEKIITELKDLREVQDLVWKLTECLTLLASTGLVQSAWIGKIYTVKPGIQVPSNDTDLIILQGNAEWEEQSNGTFATQPTSCNYVQAMEVMAQILPNLLDLIYRSEEKDKINAVIQNVLVVSTAFLKTKNVDNIPSLRAASRLTAEVSYFHYTRKSWKRDIFDLFLEKSFFEMTSEMVALWKIVIDNLMTHDKITFKEFLGQGNIAGVTGGLIKSREFELDLKAKLLKRLAFVVFASEKDQYNRILPELQERVSDMLKTAGSSPVVMEQIFLVFRIFLIRLNQDSLIALWPIMISELTVQLRQLEFDLMAEAGKLNMPNGSLSTSSGGLTQHQMNENWLDMYLSMAKFLDTALLLSRMSLSHFQTYLWAFVGISNQESSSYQKSRAQVTSFVPYCVRIAQLLEARLTSKQLANKMMPAHFGYPLLHFQYYKLTNISQLQPFFSTICYHTFEQNNITLPSEQSTGDNVPRFSDDLKAKLNSSEESKNYIQNLRKKLLHVNNLPLSQAKDSSDFLEKLVERDFAELLA